jgi:hypothetical protein
MSGLINFMQVFGGANLLLDLYPADAAYSLRKLRTDYSGSAIRVRRSSDDAEQDIGFVSNELDTASLLSFVGAGDGFVKTWYDQSLNGNNAVEGVANNLIIVQGGVVTTNNLKPCIKVGSISSVGMTTLVPTINKTQISVVNPETDLTWSIFRASDNSVFPLIQSGNFSGVAAGYTYSDLIVNGDIIGATTRNDLYLRTNNRTNLITTNITNKNINGLYSRGGFTLDGVGNFQETILFDANQMANINDIQNNINAYYSIY